MACAELEKKLYAKFINGFTQLYIYTYYVCIEYRQTQKRQQTQNLLFTRFSGL